MTTKNDVFREHIRTYLTANKDEKGKILDHVCFVTSMHRKAAVRKFKALQMRHPYITDHRGRSTRYTPDVTAALKDVWEAGNEVCGELLYPLVKEYIQILIRDGMWKHDDEATGKLRAMSIATMKRRVGGFMKARRRRNGISTTRPSHIKHLIPIFTGPWDTKPPGYGQLDTVLHSNSASGDAVYTLNYTDTATMGVFPRAQWNKGQIATQEGLSYIKDHLYFPLRGVHPDTGSEFVNYHLMTWCEQHHIEMTRSRPNHKNDNMYVEERNGHVIRKQVGYITLDCREAVDALNELYEVLTPYLFHFVAVRRMVSKERVGSKYKRIYEVVPKTPYQRTIEHTAVLPEIKEKLHSLHEELNPLILKREIDRRLRNVYAVQQRFGN